MFCEVTPMHVNASPVAVPLENLSPGAAFRYASSPNGSTQFYPSAPGNPDNSTDRLTVDLDTGNSQFVNKGTLVIPRPDAAVQD